jgi:hypothetical protein
MPEGMWRIFRLAILVKNTRCPHGRINASAHYTVVISTLARFCGKNKITRRISRRPNYRTNPNESPRMERWGDERPLIAASCRSISRLINWSRVRWEQLQQVGVIRTRHRTRAFPDPRPCPMLRPSCSQPRRPLFHINRQFRDGHHSREADSAVHNTPNSEEWRHQTRDGTYQSTDFLFGIAMARGISWFRAN